MAVFVSNYPAVHVTVAIGIGRRPFEHLHPGCRTVCRRTEIRIIDTAAVLGIGLNCIAPKTAEAVIVRLKIACGGRKPILVVNVVEDIVPVKEVGHGRNGILQRRQRRVERSVKVERGSAVRARSGIGYVIGIAVEMGIDIVTSRIGKFSSGDAVRIVPAKGRSRRIRRIGNRPNKSVIRMLTRHRHNCIGFAVDPIGPRGKLAGLSVDTHVIPMLAVGSADDQAPGQSCRAIFRWNVM